MISILYVDDEFALLEVTKLYLERSGDFVVDTAESAQRGLALLKEKQYDIVVSDYQMPGMDGIEFLRALRKEYPNLPFIIFTGKGREEIVIQAFDAGADSYLQKGGAPRPQYAELIRKITSIVDQRRSAARAATLNKLYSVLSSTNHAIIHRKDVKSILDEICRIAINNGGFRMVWAGKLNEISRIIEPIASCGVIEGYLERATVTTDDVPRGRGPTGTAYRTGQYSIVNDIATDPSMEPWREDALARGYRSIAAFPFALKTRYAGTLTLYAPEPRFFDDQIVKLLEEMAADITFALKSLEDEEERIKAEADLRRNAEKFRSIFDAAPVLICSISRLGIIADCNRRSEDLLGYTKSEIVGKSFDTILQKEDRNRAIFFLNSVLKEGSVPPEIFRLVRKNADIIDTQIHASGIRDRKGSFFRAIWIIEDITAQLKMEDELRKKKS